MESRLEVMLAAVKIVRPALNGFYQSLSDEQKARFNAVAPTDGAAAGNDQRDFASAFTVTGVVAVLETSAQPLWLWGPIAAVGVPWTAKARF